MTKREHVVEDCETKTLPSTDQFVFMSEEDIANLSQEQLRLTFTELFGSIVKSYGDNKE